VDVGAFFALFLHGPVDSLEFFEHDLLELPVRHLFVDTPLAQPIHLRVDLLQTVTNV